LDFVNSIASIRVARRFTFGCAPKDFEAQATLSVEAWLQRQLALAKSSQPVVDEKLATAIFPIRYSAGPAHPEVNDPQRPLSWLMETPAKLAALAHASFDSVSVAEKTRPITEVTIATLIRQLHSEAQLFESVVHFWNDHFYVAASSDVRCAAMLPLFDRALRLHALGNFADLLLAVARQPSFLIYFDQPTSSAPNPTQNLARELMELHTLGAAAYRNDAETQPLGYGELDVRVLSDILAGWSYGFGQRLSATDAGPGVTGEFSFLPGLHAEPSRSFLGHTLNERGQAQGEAALRLLASHPKTAEHICRKLARRFVAEQPPTELIEKLVQVWQDEAQASDQLAKVISTLVRESVHYPELLKFRRPYEYALAIWRPLRAKASVTPTLLYLISQMGQAPYAWPAPDGYPEQESAWVTREGLLWRFNFAAFLIYANETVGTDFSSQEAFSLMSQDELIQCYASTYAHRQRIYGGFQNAPMRFDPITLRNSNFQAMQKELEYVALDFYTQYR
jgi:uncharacterized protein (DUF1800 family)